MKSITVDLPNGTMCAVLSYVFVDIENGCGMKMGALSIDTEMLDSGHVEAKTKEE